MMELIAKIAARAKFLSGRPSFDKIDCEMDLFYCIKGGCKLRLQDMLEADDTSLMHDIYGISRHLNHSTHKLEHGFWPRFATREAMKEE